MSNIDLVFEGGGAKGAVFVGALDVLFGEYGHTHGRLLGTSAGAITAVLLAAGYTVTEMLEALRRETIQASRSFPPSWVHPPHLTRKKSAIASSATCSVT